MFGIFEKEVNEFLPTWMDQSWTNGRCEWFFSFWGFFSETIEC